MIKQKIFFCQKHNKLASKVPGGYKCKLCYPEQPLTCAKCGAKIIKKADLYFEEKDVWVCANCLVDLIEKSEPQIKKKLSKNFASKKDSQKNLF